MKKIKLALLLLALLLLPKIVYASEIDIYFFYQSSCPHCKDEHEYLNDLDQDENINIHYYQVDGSKKNQNLLKTVKKVFKMDDSYVPYIVIGSNNYTGFNETVSTRIEEDIKNYNDKECDVVASILGTKESCVKIDKDNKENFNLPILGNINVKNTSLLIISIIIGFIDGFNPCAMWVLLFLISMLLNMKDRKRMWILGLTFLFTSAMVYFLIMNSWLNIVLTMSQISIVRYLIGLVAIIGSIINLKSYFKSNSSGCEVVDERKRTKIFTRIKNYTQKKSLIISLFGIISVAISVNVIELACSAGLPLIFTQILAINNLGFLLRMFYMIIYIFFFMIDDLIIFFIAMKTLKITALSTKYKKYSHLIGGILMLLIGVLLIFKPSWIMFNF